METYQSFTSNDQGGLQIAGVDVAQLAKEYGTPLYLMDEDQVRHACRRYRAAMEQNFGPRCHVSYASKALCIKAMYPILAQEGLWADVVSGGELYTALAAGFDPAKLQFHGNNKTEAELRYGVESGIGGFIADNREELLALEQLGAEYGKTLRVSLRVKPGVDAHTHEFISTGNIDSKFGFSYENGEAMAAARLAGSLPHLELWGLHCHIGSQIFLTEPYGLAADVMLRLMAQIKEELGQAPQCLNLGGGFGIAYGPQDRPVPMEEMVAQLAKAVERGCRKYGLEQPYEAIEPGRSIVGPAGVTVYTVGSVKHIAGVRTYVAVDGGMPDNPRYALYGATYQAVRAARWQAPKTMEATIAGKCCESGDLVVKDAQIQPVEKGDLLCVFSTGAYNYSMASNYNRIPRPPVVFLRQGKHRLAVRRETYEQLVQNDL